MRIGRMSPARLLACAIALGLAGVGCAAKDLYWQKQGEGEQAFRKASRSCGRRAVTALANESGEQCGYNTEGRGTLCRRVDPSDPFQAEQEKRRQERRLRFIYSECMENRGWLSNTGGKGFKGRY